TQYSIIQDDAKVIASGEATRDATLNEMQSLGADVVKISISWRDLAGGGKPANPDDPNAYPAANWAPYDAAVQGAIARGMGVFLNVGGPAPDWAAKGTSTPPGAYRPAAGAFGHFARAVGTRYSGAFVPATPPAPPAPGGTPKPCIVPPLCGSASAAAAGALPAVHLWS